MPVITKRFIDSLSGDGKLRIIPDDDLPGFALQVTASGAVSYCIDYRVHGKRKRRVIGRHGPLTPDQARRLALAQLGQAASGKDPLPTHPVTTVAELFEAWMARHVTVHLRPATVANYRIIFDTHCRPRFGALAPHKLTFTAVAEALAEMKATPVAANHMIRRMRSLMIWAEDHRLVTFKDGNPARGHRLYRERPVERILSVAEIRTFITRLPDARMDEATRTCLMLELLTGQRSGEIAGIRRAHVDLNAATWTIPGPLNKPGHTHVVPLPPWARGLIGEALGRAKGVFLFPSAHGDPTAKTAAPIIGNAATRALARAQRPLAKDGTPKPRRKDATWVFDFRDAEDEPNPISPHDLRRTCSSYLELLGHGDVIRGAILNHAHSRNVTAKHYSAAELLKLKRSALLDWEAALRAIMAGNDPFSASIEDDRSEERRKLGLSGDTITVVPRFASVADDA